MDWPRGGDADGRSTFSCVQLRKKKKSYRIPPTAVSFGGKSHCEGFPRASPGLGRSQAGAKAELPRGSSGAFHGLRQSLVEDRAYNSKVIDESKIVPRH